MSILAQRRDRAIAELTAQSPTLPAAEIVDGLMVGLTQLRDLLIRRLHKDVQRLVTDSVLAPISGSHETIQLERASREIDAYVAVEAADEVLQGGYLNGSSQRLLDWVIELRNEAGVASDLKELAQPYVDLADKDRRLRLASRLQRTVPESIRSPAVLYHLLPFSVRIAAAMTLGNTERAGQLRSVQTAVIPAIGDCDECHGRVLNQGASCRQCGNPLWYIAWLRVV